MSRVRVIKFSSEYDDTEDVIFTDDFDCPATDFIDTEDMTVDFDTFIEDVLPPTFPLNYMLRRRD